jgi:hypothetical protein
MRERRLTLRSEALTELASDDLTAVVGGATPLCLTVQPTLCGLCQLLTRQTCA